jgi:CheY-like chemotaxis protein
MRTAIVVTEPEATRTTPRRGDAGRHPPSADDATRVLVVDDDAAVRRLVALVLERDGFEVTTVDDGGDAIAIGRRRPFDVLLLDVQMPGIDGWQVLETLCGTPAEHDAASDGEACPMAAVVMSGHAARGEALRRGASALLRKPFSPSELLAAVRDAALAPGLGRSDARDPLLLRDLFAPPDALAA